MKKRFSLVLLLTFLMGVLPSSVAFSQTYTISPTGYTEKPSYQSLSNSWIGYTTGSNSIWIETKAVKSGSSVVFYVRKSSGTFQNKVSFIIRRDVTVSGSTVTSEGTKVGSGSISAGKSSGTCTITPTSGSHEYRVILTSGSMTFYSRMVKINASSLATPDYTKFKATNITTTGFTANWSAVSGATQYDILVKKASDSDYSNPVYDGGTSSTSCKITGLQPNTSYQFQVRAKNSTQYSSWSKSIQTPVTTKANDLATPDYTKFKATNITTTGFTANWSAVSGATQYDILVKKASDGDYSNPVYDGGTSSTSCKITGLQPNTSYQFQVRAKNSTQYSSWSKSIQTPVTTKANDLATPDYTKFKATNITTTGFTANWSAVSGATQYDILVKKASDSDYSNPVFDGGTSSTSCKITGLQPNTSYQFQVRAKNSTQYSSWSKSIQTSITTLGEYTLDTPDYTQFTYSNVTSTGFRAKWSSVSRATKYNILVKKASDTNYSNPVYEAKNLTTTYCDVTGLQSKTAYQFQIQAINSTEKSSWSRSIQTSITTLGEKTLDTPDYTKFSATNITTTGFTANWSSVSGATQYDILVKKASDSDYSNPVFDGGTTSTSCKITGLQPKTSYQFQIRAKNSTQYSSWSKSIQTPITTKRESTYDVNNDGSIDNGDMNDLLGIVLGRDDGMDMDDFTFDTNDDGKVDVTDIVQLISMMNDVKEGRFHDIDEENEGGNVDPTETEQQIEQLPSDEDGTSETVYDEAESLEYDALAQEVISMYDTDDDSDYYGNEVNKTRASDDELAKEAIRKNGNNIFKNQLTIEQQNWDSKRWGNTRYGGFKTFYNTQVKNGRRYLLVVFYYKGGFPNKKTAYLKLGQLNNGKVISKSTIYSNQEYAVLRVCIDDYLQNYGCFNIFPMLITEGSNARNYLNPFLVKSNKIVDSDWRNKYYGYEFGKINGVSVYFNADTQKGNTNQGNGWHQCVELCKRYVTYLNGYLNRKETDTWGNAINWPANRANDAKDPGMYLVFANDGRERVREGDLIVWQYGTYGHIGVVISVKPDRISVAHQNGGKGTCASPIGTSMKLENGVIKDIVPGTNHSPIFKSIQYVPYFIRINSGGEHYVPYNASMSASTTNMKFNPTQLGKSLTKTFIIYNSKGMGTLNISSIAAKKGNGFSVDVTKCSIEPGGFQPVNVTFTPSASGEYKDLIMIQSDADDNPTWTIHLSGTGK